MKKTRKIFALLMLLGCLTGLSFPAAAENAESGTEEDEWTVLFYLCGSDLESKYSYASANLEEIQAVVIPEDLPTAMARYELATDVQELKKPGTVNVVIQTGGCREWHTEKLGMDISAEKLQRWKFKPAPENDDGGSDSAFEMVEEAPLASMADAGTLTDFIRWGVQKYPAKKYALVLWDHGGGAKTGLFIDELYDGDILYLHELKKSLADADVHFEAVVIDACMMANIETACALKDNADWMVASEEEVPGKGTAIEGWLQELFNNPECDGYELGRNVCNMTQIKFANEDDRQARTILTLSVIDLSKIDRLYEAMSRFFQSMGEMYKKHPDFISIYSEIIYNAEEYGDGQQNMRDFGGVLYGRESVSCMDLDLRTELVEAFSDAVTYVIRGAGRSGAYGLSFCYPTDFDSEELNIYAENFRCAPYLAFLDAVTEWTAPDWVYEQTERLPSIDTIESLQLKVKKCVNSSGMPAIVLNNLFTNLYGVYVRLYYLDEKMDQVVCLGRVPVKVEATEEGLTYSMDEKMQWMSIEGIPCQEELILEKYRYKKNEYEMLFHVPIQLEDNVYNLRCSRRFSISDNEDDIEISKEYSVYGVWEGYDEDSEMMNRGVKDLAKLVGQEYYILNQIDENGENRENGQALYKKSGPLTMYRTLEFNDTALPAGTYYLEYEADDMFMRPFVLDRVQVSWDGEKVTLPEGVSWEGEEILL